MIPEAGVGAWSSDWLWGVPLIGLTMVIHALGLGLIGNGLARALSGTLGRPHPFHHVVLLFSAVTTGIALLLALLHGLGAAIWALAYLELGAISDYHRAIYFSLTMITTLGADGIDLERHWRLMGSLEAMDGMLLFGLSTAFLFAVLQNIWPFTVKS
jgi:hypothetical protein